MREKNESKGRQKMDVLNSNDYNYIEVGNVDEDGILIFVHQSLKDTIFSKARNPILSGPSGLLLGSWIKAINRYIVHINHIMPLGRINPDQEPKAFSAKRWETVQNKAFKTFPTRRLLAGMACASWGQCLQNRTSIHQELFIKSWHVLYLLDNANEISNFFIGRVTSLSSAVDTMSTGMMDPGSWPNRTGQSEK